jgi:cyclic-di-AMP phosphodiesterase PgpH
MTPKRTSVFIYAGLLIFVSMILNVYMMPRDRSGRYNDLREGTLANENISAPFDFEILRTDDELNEIREKVSAAVLPVFDVNDTLNVDLYKKYSDFCSSLDAIREIEKKLDSGLGDSVYQALSKVLINDKSLLLAKYGISYDSINGELLGSGTRTREILSGYLRSNFNSRFLDLRSSDILKNSRTKIILKTGTGSTEHPVNDFPDINLKIQRDKDFLSSSFPEMGKDSIRYLENILSVFSKPSVIYNSEITDSIINKVRSEVPLAEGLVKKGDLIISKNSPVTKNTLKIIRSLELKRRELNDSEGTTVLKRINIRTTAGKLIISSVFYFLLVIMLFFNRKKYLYNIKLLSVIFLIMLAQNSAVYFLSKNYDSFTPYLVTMSVTSVLTAVFFDMRVSFVVTLISSVTSSIIMGSSFLYFFIPLASGLCTMYAVHKIRDIFSFIYRSMIFTFLGLMVCAAGFYLMFNLPYADLVTAISHSAVNAAVSPLLALTLLTIIEKLFKMPTDITLLQLSDMSNPLLRKLQTEAPGTYHHSITVGNLAEAAAEAINANSLLARVGAYYHDIGKTFKSEYFIENQKNSYNKHDKIAPNMSAFILSAHVKEGIKLAYEHHLPEVIIDFIRTHHGCSRMEYFYTKALNQAKVSDDKVNESVYRYTGPKPNSKETAIVMISDIVEAKCRTESSAGADRFRQIISEIILDRLQSGELDDCDIKINDLRKIREAMIPVITGMYHQRIKYPAKAKDPENENIETNLERSDEEK